MKDTDLPLQHCQPASSQSLKPNPMGNPQYSIRIYKLQSHKLVKHITRGMYVVTIIPKHISLPAKYSTACLDH